MLLSILANKQKTYQSYKKMNCCKMQNSRGSKNA